MFELNNPLNTVVVQQVPVEEILCQLAEEASETAQAALKLRRTLSSVNPTPVTPEKAKAGLIEELADVLLCMSVLETAGILNYSDQESIRQIKDFKLTRWCKRLIQSKGEKK